MKGLIASGQARSSEAEYLGLQLHQLPDAARAVRAVQAVDREKTEHLRSNRRMQMLLSWSHAAPITHELAQPIQSHSEITKTLRTSSNILQFMEPKANCHTWICCSTASWPLEAEGFKDSNYSKRTKLKRSHTKRTVRHVNATSSDWQCFGNILAI